MYLLAMFLFSWSKDIAVMSKSINIRLALVQSIFNEFGMLIFRHFIYHILLVEETGVPDENHRLTPSHWQLSHAPVGIQKQFLMEVCVIGSKYCHQLALLYKPSYQ